MEEFCCTECGSLFKRYKSTVRDLSRVFCSKSCSYKNSKTYFAGKGNPSYKHGKYVDDSLCGCGLTKDVRSERCAMCAHRGFRINSEPRLDLGLVTESVQAHRSISAAARDLNVSRNQLSQFIKLHKIDVGHMVSARNRLRPDAELFILSKYQNRSAVRNRFREVSDYKCACGLTDIWQGSFIVLQMDHINGNSCDNRLDNLRWLCPNCHSQTETFCGKNMRRSRK